MKTNLFNIDDSEKQRILEMHQTATKKQYLNEQSQSADTKSFCSKYGNLVSGMVWSECKEDADKKSVDQHSKENEEFLKTYYKGDLNGKIAVFFNIKQDQFPYLITNITDFFQIGSNVPSKTNANDFYVLSVDEKTEKPYSNKYARVLGKGNVKLFKQGSNAGYTQVESPISYWSL